MLAVDGDLAPDVDRSTDLVQETVRDLDRMVDVADLLEQDRELVAGQAAGRVTRSDGVPEAPGDLHAAAGPRSVAQGVVDVLEVVEVDQQHRGHGATPSAAGQRMADAVGEEGAVGETGQRVVERLVAELRLEVAPLGDVVGVDDEPANGGVIKEVVRGPVEGDPAPVAMQEPGLAHDLPVRALGDGREMAGEDVAVVGVDAVGEPPADPILRPVAEQSLDGHALIQDTAVPVDHDEQVRRVLDQRAEACLAVGEGVGQPAELAVLATHPAGGAIERGHEQRREDDRDDDGDPEHVTSRGGDVRVDGCRALIDLVGGDDLAVASGDRQVDLEEPVGQAVLELVLGRGAVRDVMRDLAVEGLHEVVVDLEPSAAQGRQVREQHSAVAAPDLDAEEVARPDELFELGVDLLPGGAVRGSHRALGQDRVDEPVDDQFGAVDRLVGGGLTDMVRHDLGGQGRGAQHTADHRGDEDHTGSWPSWSGKPASQVWSVVRSGIDQAWRSNWHATPPPGCRRSAP